MRHSMPSPNTLRRRLPERFNPALESFHAREESLKHEIRALLAQCLKVDDCDRQSFQRLRRMGLQVRESGLQFVFNLVVGSFSHDVSSGPFRR